MNVAYGVCVGSWDKYRRYVEPRIDAGRVVLMVDQTSIGEAYNTVLDSYAAYPPDAVILLHDDLEIVDPRAEEKFLAALAQPEVVLAGIAGGSGVTSLAWWEANTVGHQQTDAMMIDFGGREGDVDLLEGSILVFSPWAVKNLRFDLRFTGFHGYDDIAMIAKAAGKRVYVADVDTHHHTSMGFKTPESAAAWQNADRMFREKWGFSN